MRTNYPLSIAAAFIGIVRHVVANPAAVVAPYIPRDLSQPAERIIYEAEFAASFDPSSVVDGANSGARGDRYVDMGGIGSYLEFVVDEAGDEGDEDYIPDESNDCAISFRYASASKDGATRPCSVSINGTVIDTLHFSTTHWWRRWDQAVVWTKVDCSPGTTIRLTALSKHGGPNIDYMALDFMYQLDPNQSAGSSLRGSLK